jgi:hypothetical protein
MALAQNEDAEHDQHLRTRVHPPIRNRTLQRTRRRRRLCEGLDHAKKSKTSSGDLKDLIPIVCHSELSKGHISGAEETLGNGSLLPPEV